MLEAEFILGQKTKDAYSFSELQRSGPGFIYATSIETRRCDTKLARQRDLKSIVLQETMKPRLKDIMPSFWPPLIMLFAMKILDSRMNSPAVCCPQG